MNLRAGVSIMGGGLIILCDVELGVNSFKKMEKSCVLFQSLYKSEAFLEEYNLQM